MWREKVESDPVNHGRSPDDYVIHITIKLHMVIKEFNMQALCIDISKS